MIEDSTMETTEKKVELNERRVEVKGAAMDGLQRAITKAWVLLLTNDEFIRQINPEPPESRPVTDIAADLSGMNPPPQEIIDLVGYAISAQELVAGSGVSINVAFNLLRGGFQANAASGWGGGGPHPRREELDATF